jgi:hypothetical protein
MQKRSHDPVLERFDRLQTMAFDRLAKFYPAELIFDGKKAIVISTAIQNEYVQEIVGYLPKKSASVEIKLTDLKRLGCTNESYVSIDDVVLRLRQVPQDGADISLKFYAHSTPNQPAASTQEGGSVNLAIDQVEVPLTFRIVDPKADYVFTTLYVENAVDAQPLDLEITPGARTATGRTIHLNGLPDSANYVLRWRVTS